MKPSYPLATTTWDDEEVAAIQSVIASGMYTMGPRVAEFERAFADFTGSKYCVMSNSGSSANLLMIAALRFREDAARRSIASARSSYFPSLALNASVELVMTVGQYTMLSMVANTFAVEVEPGLELLPPG